MWRPLDLRALPAYARIQRAWKASRGSRIDERFAQDPERFQKFHVQIPGWLYDFSKQDVDDAVWEGAMGLAHESGLKEAIEDLFRGVRINATEDRAVLHMALRARAGDVFRIDGKDVVQEVLAVRGRMWAFVDEVRGAHRWKHVVHIGIGGSDLGPLMVHRALRNHVTGPAVHYVSNVDSAHLDAVLAGLDARETLVVVVSKTFTTQETMANARAARSWVEAALGPDAVAEHFAAVSSRVDRAVEFGIQPERVFGFEDWVGGRYSLWGPVGLTVALAIGKDAFEELLDGARAMDLHFREAEWAQNLPVVMALLGWLNVEMGGMPSAAVLPYAQDLDRLPAYLQQTDMESNGKHTGRDGEEVQHATGPVVWGEAGTNGQHAFYQLLHQGTHRIPADFIAFREPLGSDPVRHNLLLANAIAQSQALMSGQTHSQALTLGLQEGATSERATVCAPHRVFEGNRPSSFSLLDRLDPHHLGMLLAAHEHRIFVQGFLWNIYSFDQWGVELGKQLANRILDDQASGAPSAAYDSSTAALLAKAGFFPSR